MRKESEMRKKYCYVGLGMKLDADRLYVRRSDESANVRGPT